MTRQTTIRRQERKISQEEAVEILDRAEFGVLSMVDDDGTPYGVPVNFVRENDRLIFHCALEGRKLDCIRYQHQVSFCAVGRTHVLPDRFSTEYESVTVSGTAEIITDENRKRDDLMILCKKYAPEYLDLAETYINKSLHQTGIVEILIESVTGKARKPK